MTLRETWNASVRALVMLAFVFASLAGISNGATAAAQETGLVDDTTYVLESTDEVVTWDDPWDFDEDISEAGDGFEIVALTGGSSSLLLSVLPGGLDIEEARDLVLDEFAAGTDGFATIDRGAYGAISYSLDLADVGGTDLGVFTLFRSGSGNTPTFAYIFISSVQGFSDGFSSAQEQIAIDGEPIFEGVDGDGLQTQLEQKAGAAPEPADDTPESEDTETPDAAGDSSGEPADSSAIFETRDKVPDIDEDGNTSGDAADRDDEIDDEFIDLGVVSQGEYVSPQFGSELLWDDTWELFEDADQPVISDEDEGTDVLNLAWDGNGVALLRVEFLDAQDATPADVVEFWTSAEFLGETSDVVLEDSGRDVGGVVALDATEDGSDIVVYREVHLVDDGQTLVLITFLSEPAVVEDAISDAQGGVELDDEPVLSFYDVEDIVEAVE